MRAQHSQKVFSSQPLIMQKRFHKLALLLISRKLIGIYIDKTLLKRAHQGRGRAAENRFWVRRTGHASHGKKKKNGLLNIFLSTHIFIPVPREKSTRTKSEWVSARRPAASWKGPAGGVLGCPPPWAPRPQRPPPSPPRHGQHPTARLPERFTSCRQEFGAFGLTPTPPFHVSCFFQFCSHYTAAENGYKSGG